MKTDDELHALLHSDRIEVELPPDFQRGVWRRIAQESARPQPFLYRISSWFAETFAVPQVAGVIALAALIAGVSLGSWQGNHEINHTQTQLEAEYAVSINPIAMAQKTPRS